MGIKVRSPIVLEKEPKINPRVKDILKLLAAGSVLAAFIAFPALPLAAAPVFKRRRRWVPSKDWDKFNLWKLRSELKRLKKQKDVKVEIAGGFPVVKLTNRGQRKVLRYKLEEMRLEAVNRWDKKWRVIAYDIPKQKKKAREAFRSMLKQLKIYQLQKSVYLTPFPCEDEIQFISEFFDIGDEVKILTVTGLEDEKIYRRYFGI